MHRGAWKISLFAILLCSLAACSSGSDSDDDSSDSGSTSSGSTSSGSTSSGGEMMDVGPGVAFSSTCGAVIDNVLVNPVPSVNLEEVTVEVLRHDILVVTRVAGIEAGNSELVKLHGVSSAGLRQFQIDRAESLLRELTAGGAFFAQASTAEPIPDPETGAIPDTCSTTFDGGGVGTVGQLFTRDGRNIAEILISERAAVGVSELCSSSLLLDCYASLEPEEELSPEIITRFLWKPVSERDGGLVVLVNPVGITVVVAGAVTETLVDFGPSNGRGTTARSQRPGSAFGGNIRVTFFDAQGRPVLLADGSREVIVPNGADRLEF